MKLIIPLFLLPIFLFPQIQGSKIDVKGDRNNVKVIQGNIVVDYNLTDNQSVINLLKELKSLPVLNKETKDLLKTSNEILELLKIVNQKTKKEGVLDIAQFARKLEFYMNDQLMQKLISIEAKLNTVQIDKGEKYLDAMNFKPDEETLTSELNLADSLIAIGSQKDGLKKYDYLISIQSDNRVSSLLTYYLSEFYEENLHMWKKIGNKQVRLDVTKSEIKATELLNTSIQLWPDNYYALESLVRKEIENVNEKVNSRGSDATIDDYSYAIKLIRKGISALQKVKEEPYDFYDHLFSIYYELNKTDLVALEAKMAYENAPIYYMYLCELGKAHLKQGKFKEAENELKKSYDEALLDFQKDEKNRIYDYDLNIDDVSKHLVITHLLTSNKTLALTVLEKTASLIKQTKYLGCYEGYLKAQNHIKNDNFNVKTFNPSIDWTNLDLAVDVIKISLFR